MAKQSFHGVPVKAGEAGSSPHYSFPGEANPFYLDSSLTALSNDLGDGLMQAK